MTKLRKVVVFALAFLMIFSCISAVASAEFDPDVSDGKVLDITAKIYKEVDGTWVECTKAAPGEDVKVRVSVDTDYYAGTGDFLFFFDNDFFDWNASSSTVTVNSAYDFSAAAVTSADTASLGNAAVANEMITSDFLAAHDYMYVTLYYADADDHEVQMFSDEDWLFEINLKVADEPTDTEGTFSLQPTTIMRPAGSTEVGSFDGYVNVLKGEQGTSYTEAFDMWIWDVNYLDNCYATLTTQSSVTLKANGGTFADDATEVTYTGAIGSDITYGNAPTNGTKTLVGWYKEGETVEDWETDTTTLPEKFSTEDDEVYLAYWVDKVNVTFDYGYEGSSPATISVTPGYTFEAPTDPVRTGYSFKGWSPELPAVYADTDKTYTAQWAKQITITVKDMVTGATLYTSPVVDAGDPVSSTVSQAITAAINTAAADNAHKDIYYYADNVLADLGEAYPAESTEYIAEFEGNVFPVKFVVLKADGSTAFSTTRQVQYGDSYPGTEIFSIYPVPAGKEIDGWYATNACTGSKVTELNAAGTTVYGKLADIDYTITFYKADNTDVFATATYHYGDTIVDPVNYSNVAETAPAKAGYIFVGWTPRVGMVETPADYDFYPTYKLAPANVTFYADEDGDNVAEIYQAYELVDGEDFYIPADPYKPGNTFINWYTDIDCTQVASFPETYSAASTPAKFYAKFTANDYTARFHNADDSLFIDPPVSVATGALVSKPATDPVKAGYTFQYWKNDSDEQVDWTNEIMNSEDGKDYYPYFTANTDTKYTVKVYEMTADGEYPEEPLVIDTGRGTTDTEFTYSDVYTIADGLYLNEETSTTTGNINGDGKAEITIYIDRETYTATFNNGEEGDAAATATTTALYGAIISEPETPFTKTGYTLVGWNADAAAAKAGTKDIDALDSMPLNGTTLYAVWQVNSHTLTLQADLNNDGAYTGEGEKTTDSKDYGTVITFAKGPDKPSYEFLYWLIGEDKYYENDTLSMPDSDVTATAVYKLSKLSVTFMLDSGEGYVEYAAGTCIVGDKLSTMLEAFPTEPTKAGYNFSGWADADKTAYTADSVMPANALVLYGSFTAREDIALTFVTPTRVTATGTNYGLLKGTPVTVADYAVTGTYGESFTAPAAPTAAQIGQTDFYNYYKFLGWSATEGATTADYAAGASVPVPTDNTTYYAVYERELVYLIAKDDEVTIIDREDEATGDNIGYWDEEDWSYWFVYGFPVRTVTFRNYATYLDVHGDGYYEVEASENGYGTGSIITVYDAITDEVVEQFYFIFFGDINGDGRINAIDTSTMSEELSGDTNWSKARTRVTYMFKAADINSVGGDGRVNAIDSAALSSYLASDVTIDQTFGGVPDEDE